MSEMSLDALYDQSTEALELYGVLDEVARHVQSHPGRERVLSSEPTSDLEQIRDRLKLVAELREVLHLGSSFGLNSVVPIEIILDKLESPAVILEAEEILAVADVLQTTVSVRRRLLELDERYTRLKEILSRISPAELLLSEIRRVLDEQGEVRSDASPRLVSIREQLRTVRRRIHKQLEDIVTDRDLARVVQEDYVTLRNDRYVILLRPEFKGALDGIVHDHSGSRASVYVEPLAVVESNNRVAALIDEERDEIRRIFRELTDKIHAAQEDVRSNYDLLAFLDAYQARARYAQENDCVEPELTESGFSLLGARHPLLERIAGHEPVPMDVIQEGDTLVTVISGANMGGKTVALKIAGLLPLMTRCGMQVPAREGTKVCPFARIMADIGDEQSIRGRVSSFSGHMQRINTILGTAGPGDLVLLDELGGATDPEEGSAIAMAVMDEIVARRANAVVTTHLSHLKAYAVGKEDVKNVSVEFHPQTLQPTFRLLYDLPGESHAIATAERIGLPEHVITKAKQYLDKAAGGSSKLIADLRARLVELDRKELALNSKEQELSAELEDLRQSKETELEDIRAEARELLRLAEKQVADLQKSLKAGGKKKGLRPKDIFKDIRSQVEAGLGGPLEPDVVPPSVGEIVRLKSLGRDGVVQAVLAGNEVEVAVGSMKIRAALEDLERRSQSQPEKKSSKNERIRVDIPLARPRSEVNVIGLRVDEALSVVDRALDEAVLGGLSYLQVVHGKGSGRLKEAIREHLSRHSMVTDLRSGDLSAGGEGVTILELASGEGP
jgi:DNA mismatch repair protein MutS2